MLTSQNNTEYMCKLNQAIFKHPCTVTKCFAHISNLSQSKVKPVSITNCAHADFALQGFSENLDYAVEEQGFVGFRDLQYLSPFFNVPANELRELYTENVSLFKKCLSILWNAKDNNTHYCKHCGHPLKDKNRFSCVSETICKERQSVVGDIAYACVEAVLEPENHAKVFNVIWRSLTENFATPIILSDEEKRTLQDLRNQ